MNYNQISITSFPYYYGGEWKKFQTYPEQIRQPTPHHSVFASPTFVCLSCQYTTQAMIHRDMFRKFPHKQHRFLWVRHNSFLSLSSLLRQLRLEHLRCRRALEKLFIVDEQRPKDFEIVGHRCGSTVAAKTVFASWQRGAIWVVDWFSSLLVSDRQVCHTALHFWVLIRPEGYVFHA